MGIARPQHRTDQTSSLSVKDYQRVIHVLIVVFLKEGQLLLAVRRIVGRVNIQDTPGWRFSERAHLLLLELAQDRPPRMGVHCILQPRELRLRGESVGLGRLIAHTLE